MYMSDRTEQLNELLGLSIAAFDIPDDVYARAVSRYEDAAHSLADFWPDGAGQIYPQGSIRLGTVTAPINPADEYDLDWVCRRDLSKASTSQADLKEDVGYGLQRYVARQHGGMIDLHSSKRCWTLNYVGEPFHMDVLPAIPNDDEPPNAIWLTDRELRNWQPSNPIEYAEWFQLQMEAERALLLEAIAKRMEIEQAPPSAIKTTLQRAVQALKRHRDIFFAAEECDGPASIIVTTLAAGAYSPGGGLHEVLVSVTEAMPDLVERHNGKHLIKSPVSDENFADRWNQHPERAEHFFTWIEQAHADFAGLGAELGMDRIVESMTSTFGEEPARRAADQFGSRLRRTREEGKLGVRSSGLLVPAAGRAIPDHTFHGDAPRPNRP